MSRHVGEECPTEGLTLPAPPIYVSLFTRIYLPVHLWRFCIIFVVCIFFIFEKKKKKTG